MIGALVIVFREVIEAGLIVGIVLAATRGVPHRGLWVGFGILCGLAGAGIVAVFAGGISMAFEGRGQELLNAAVLLLAVAMLAWHNAWMARHGRELAMRVRSVGEAVSAGEQSLAALAIVCGVAVLREGSEVVLFLYGIVASGTSGTELLIGGLLGILGGAALTGLSYLGLIAIWHIAGGYPGEARLPIADALKTLLGWAVGLYLLVGGPGLRQWINGLRHAGGP